MTAHWNPPSTAVFCQGSSSLSSPPPKEEEINSPPQHAHEAPRVFEFVAGDDAEIRRMVGKHVMKDFIRRRGTHHSTGRGHDKGRLLWTKDSAKPGFTDAHKSSHSTASQTTLSRGDDKIYARRSKPFGTGLQLPKIETNPPFHDLEDEESSSLIRGDAPTTPEAIEFHDAWQVGAATRRRVDGGYPSPQSLLDAGRSEPFESFPVTIKETDRALIDHYLDTLPFMQYKMSVAVEHNLHKMIFHRISLHSPTAFEAMLAIAATHMASVNVGADTMRSLTHQMRAIRLINRRLRDSSTRLQDDIMYSVATMSVISARRCTSLKLLLTPLVTQKWAKNPEAEKMHNIGMYNLIRHRGGMEGIRASSRFLEAVLYWVEVAGAAESTIGGGLPWSATASYSQPAAFDFLTSHQLPTSLPLGRDVEEIYDIMLACEQFLSFLHLLFCHYRQRADSPSCRYPRSLHTLRSRVLSPRSTVCSFLAASAQQRSGVRTPKDFTGLGSMLFVNFILWDYKDQPRKLERFLLWLEEETKARELAKNRSVELLLWIFWRAGEGDGNDYGCGIDEGEVEKASVEDIWFDAQGRPATIGAAERNWFITRMLRVAKRLGPGSWNRVRATLLTFLLENDDMELEARVGIDGTAPHRLGYLSSLPWNDDEMRMEILRGSGLYA